MSNNGSDRLLSPREAAQRLGTTPGTLNQWRVHERYPLPYVKVGRSVKYRSSDIDRFIEERTVTPARVVV